MFAQTVDSRLQFKGSGLQQPLYKALGGASGLRPAATPTFSAGIRVRG